MNIKLINESAQKTMDFCSAVLHNRGEKTDSNANLALVQTDIRLELRKLDEPKLSPIFVDFITGAMAHRRKFGGGRGEAIAKAVGIKGDYLPSVIDATAGLGRDAFVLASLGCQVRLVERNPVVWLLLQDGLQRAYANAELGQFLQHHLTLLEITHINQLNPTKERADVVYLDPMFPHKQKSALVKKEMRVFQHLVGADLDADALLEPAMKLAEKRVVVKRPDYAPFIANISPHFSRETKNHRFDIYSSLAQ